MCGTVRHTVTFVASPARVFDAYLDSRRQSRITGLPARMSRRPGARFESGGGYIHGVNVEILPGRRIVQAWRGDDWPEGAYSILRLEFRKQGTGTRLLVDHRGIPESATRGVARGWHEHFWRPMQRHFRGRR